MSETDDVTAREAVEEAPERIWADRVSEEIKGFVDWSEGEWSSAPCGGDTEYVRADLYAALLAERDAAYASGQAEMRERAAKACDRLAGDPRMYNDDRRKAAGQCSAAIRALPLKPRP